MSGDRHLTAPTQFVEANGARYAYRRFGSKHGTPLLFLQHFRGGMDNWDPQITDGLAEGRPVILFNYAGVASSTGMNATTIDEMADQVMTFVKALDLPIVDVLGFSIGGFVAQSLAHRHGHLVRRLVLVGTGPRNPETNPDSKVMQIAGNLQPTQADFLFLFFSPSDASQAAGRAFWDRRTARPDADPPSSVDTLKGQASAIQEWAQPRGERFAYLREISQPTLVVNGSNDIMVPTINSFILQQHIPNAQLILYPDSGHGAQFQYPDTFVTHTRQFLDSV